MEDNDNKSKDEASSNKKKRKHRKYIASEDRDAVRIVDEEPTASKQKKLKNTKVSSLFTAHEVLKERISRLEEVASLKESIWKERCRALEFKFDEKRRLEELSELLD